MLFPICFSSGGGGQKSGLTQRILPAVGYGFRIVLALALAVLVSACSAVKLGYNQAPVLAYLYLDDYADLTGVQSLQLKADLGRLHAWHRQTQLPMYADMLQKLQTVVQTSVTPAQVCALASDVRRQVLAVASQADPELAAFAASLQSEQLQQLQRKFVGVNADYRKQFIDAAPTTSRTKRYEQAVSRAERLYGPLSSEQLQRIGQRVDQSSFNAALVYAERLRRQQDVLSTVGALRALGGSPSTIRADVRALAERFFVSPNTAYRDYAEKITQESCRSVAELHATTTPAQRQKAVSVLQGYEADARALAAQGGS